MTCSTQSLAHWLATRTTRRQSAAQLVLLTMFCALSLMSRSAEGATWLQPGLCQGYTLRVDAGKNLIITNGPQVSTQTDASRPYSATCSMGSKRPTTWRTLRIDGMCKATKFTANSQGDSLLIACKK
jgi:hypothetical protein